MRGPRTSWILSAELSRVTQATKCVGSSETDFVSVVLDFSMPEMMALLSVPRRNFSIGSKECKRANAKSYRIRRWSMSAGVQRHSWSPWFLQWLTREDRMVLSVEGRHYMSGMVESIQTRSQAVNNCRVRSKFLNFLRLLFRISSH